MADLLELAEQVATADGPDRELDAEIALALGIVREREGNQFYGHRDHSVMVMERGYYDHVGSAPELPAYTASIDAALTLVPEGYEWIIGQTRSGLIVHGHMRFGNSLALSLCASALLARTSK